MNENEKTKSKNSKIAIIISILVVLMILIAVAVPKLMDKAENVQEKEKLTKWENAYMQKTENVVSETPTLPNVITKDEALKLAQKKWGTYAEETGFDIGYSYVAWIQDEQGMQYYVFDVRWFVNNDHWSWIDTVCISADGKTYREIANPANFKNGEIVKQFDSKGDL